MLRSIWVALALLPAAAPAAVEVQVRAGAELKAAEVAAERSGEPATAVRAAAKAGSVTLDLEPGEWILTASAPGYWSTSERLAVERPGEQQVELSLWPLGALVGRVRGPVGVELPASLDLVWNPSEAEEAGPPGASAVCPVTEGRWRCKLPAGRLDLFIGAPGFIHQYRWDVIVGAGESAELPDAVVLRRGAAVRGWVVTEDGGNVDGARVELEPRAAGNPRRQQTSERIAARKLATRVTDRGFFQLDAIAPGAYVATASKKGYAPARASVRVRDRQVTEIDDPPLTLRPPRTLEIYFDPPVPPIGEAWKAELTQVDRRGGSLNQKIEGTVPPGGAWQLVGVPEGRYFLDVRTTADRPEPGAGVPAWHGETLEIAADTARVFVTVPAVAVSGSVTLGDEPVQGKLIFGTRHGLPRRSLITDSAGEFSGWLPRAGLWEIEVIADAPRIEVTVQQEVEGGTEIEIEIPDTRVSGQVIDERGAPSPGAIVFLRTLGRRFEVSSDDSGVFEAAGLPAGALSLKAEHRHRKSRVQRLILEDGAKAPEVFLVVRPVMARTGRVVAPNGAGVAGAQVGAWVVEDAENPVPVSVITDEEGRFELELPAHALNLALTVAAPGFAFRALRASTRTEPLVVPVSQASGTLALRLPADHEPHRWGSPSVALIHDRRGVSNLIQLARWAALHGQEIDWPTRITVPFIEPGHYSACWAADEEMAAIMAGTAAALECVSGELSDSGELALALREAERP